MLEAAGTWLVWFALRSALDPSPSATFVAGGVGVFASAMAFVVGRAFTSSGNPLWFVFLGIVGVLSLITSFPAFLAARRILRSIASTGAYREVVHLRVMRRQGTGDDPIHRR
jgi:hypothetical protein